MTIEELKNYGANTEEGLTRCMGNEDFYFKMIGMALGGEDFRKLGDFLEAGDLDSAFESAHALKGVYGNLALTPIFDPVNEITELLRNKSDADYKTLYEKAKAKRDELIAMWEA